MDEKFKTHQEQIESVFGGKVDWIEADKACRIIARTPGDIKKGKESWPKLFDWFIDSALKIKAIVDEFDK